MLFLVRVVKQLLLFLLRIGRPNSETSMSIDESATEYPHDIDGIALMVVEQIQQQMNEYEDAVVSHINEQDFKQVELHIQAKRIENILDLCLEKIEFALLMPLIFESDAQNDQNKLIQEKWNYINGRIDSVSEIATARGSFY